MGRRTDGAWLLETRPETGLLGGMLGWPGTAWVDSGDALPQVAPPAEADWDTLSGEVRHTFTHFHLRLEVRVAQLDIDTPVSNGQFVTKDDFRPSDLPTVMRKAFDLARSAF